MRDLMRDDEPPHRRRREDQPPAQADLALRRAASPARSGIADADRADADARRRGIVRDLAAHHVERAALEEQLDPAARSPRSGRRSAARHRRAPASAARAGSQTSRTSSPSSGMVAPGSNGSPGSARASCAFDPVPLVERPGERRAAAGPPWAGQLQRSARLVEAQAQAPRVAQRADFDREPEAPPQARLQSGRSTT